MFEDGNIKAISAYGNDKIRKYMKKIKKQLVKETTQLRNGRAYARIKPIKS